MADATKKEGLTAPEETVEVEDPLAEAQAKAEELQQASQKLAEAVYAQATAQAASRSGDGVNGGTSDDEVVEEADYEVIDEEAKTSS
jgi:hypothetical protein